jgi:TetR/AcrR family transcriptional repressor of bet genes
MASRARAANKSVAVRPGRATRPRQRQRLIDACISALHIHGPSRTTVEKVVAIANLSPGIVRFYFDSKAAMLVASLQYLAAEFEDRVLLPVSQLRHAPVPALERLVDLYLDPQIASPRKVSVWYSFWGEASSRQEYYEICGRKDEDFAALVHELIERLIAQVGATHLDADGIALGLIGVLEMMWQTFAFRDSDADADSGAGAPGRRSGRVRVAAVANTADSGRVASGRCGFGVCARCQAAGMGLRTRRAAGGGARPAAATGLAVHRARGGSPRRRRFPERGPGGRARAGGTR